MAYYRRAIGEGRLRGHRQECRRHLRLETPTGGVGRGGDARDHERCGPHLHDHGSNYMKNTTETWLAALAEAARQENVVGDPRWEALAAGKLSAQDEAAL